MLWRVGRNVGGDLLDVAVRNENSTVNAILLVEFAEDLIHRHRSSGFGVGQAFLDRLE